jgi:hypothetical protein
MQPGLILLKARLLKVVHGQFTSGLLGEQTKLAKNRLFPLFTKVVHRNCAAEYAPDRGQNHGFPGGSVLIQGSERSCKLSNPVASAVRLGSSRGSLVLGLVFLLRAFLDFERDLAFGRFATEPFLQVQGADHGRFPAGRHLIESNRVLGVLFLCESDDLGFHELLSSTIESFGPV